MSVSLSFSLRTLSVLNIPSMVSIAVDGSDTHLKHLTRLESRSPVRGCGLGLGTWPLHPSDMREMLLRVPYIRKLLCALPGVPEKMFDRS